MRVLFLNPVATLGGAERVLLQCLAELGKTAEFEPCLLTLEEGELVTLSKQLGVPTAVVAVPPALAAWGDSESRSTNRRQQLGTLLRRGISATPTLVGFLGQLRRAIARFQPQLIHSNGIKTHLLTRFARPAGVPVVWHIHDFYGSRPLAAQLLRKARRGVRAAVAISQAVADDVRRCLPGMRREVIRNTVDCSRFSPGEPDFETLDRLAQMAPLPANGFRVGLVAAFARWKGHQAFLNAAAEVLQKNAGPPTRFYIVGGPLYRTSAQYSTDELREHARKLGIANNVAFVPFQSHPEFVYRSLDLVVHASELPEPFGLTIAEAMACGRPVIVSRRGGAAELFVPDVDAVGVPPGDVAALSRAVVSLRADEETRIRLGKAARARAERDFQSTRLANQLATLYHSCVPTATKSIHVQAHPKALEPAHPSGADPK